MHQSIL